MGLFVAAYHVGGYRLDVTQTAVLRAHEVAVAHQRHAVAVDTDDAVDDIAVALYPGQHHIAELQLGCVLTSFALLRGLLQDDTLASADDKRQHAAPIHGQRHTHPLLYQPDGLVDNLVVGHGVTVLLHNSAAA